MLRDDDFAVNGKVSIPGSESRTRKIIKAVHDRVDWILYIAS
jgi:hypothetical protein